jgi:phenylpropionate dioxygenase-like ring-hydroxylating dioxygenase large terminal subunit
MEVLEREIIDRHTDEKPAGGDDLDRFDPKEAWYPVYYLDDLDKSKLTTFTLLEQDLVIWWDDRDRTWRAFEDQCPHRLAPLSQGRIDEDGLLECPYHGWAFSGSGECDRIPQQVAGGKAEQSQRACVRSFPTAERQGLLFIYAGEANNAAITKIPIIEPLEESPDEWVCLNMFRDLPYDALTLLENVLDASHIPFTHHNTVGNRSNAAPVELEIVESSKHGYKGTWAEGPRRGTLGRQDTTFIAPNLMWHDLTSKQFGRTITAVYATPIRKGECRLIARFPFKFSSKLPGLFIKLTPRWYSHIGQNSVLEDDQIFLHFQERYLETSGGSDNFTKAFYLPTKADRFVSEYRQWVNQYDADPFGGQKFSPALPIEELLDRYHSHTEKCVSCRTALTRIGQIKKACIIAAAIAWSIAPLTSYFGRSSLLTAIISTIIPLMLGAVWLGLGQLEKRFYRGRLVPPRNLSGGKKLNSRV